MKRTPSQHLYIITHCESCFNQRRIFTGRINSHLTKNGIEHAKEMAEKLKDTQIDLVIHTSLDRTKETLKYILKYHPKTKVELNDSMIERDYGQLSRKSKDKYQREHQDVFPLYHRSYDVSPPGGESIKQVEARVVPFLEELTGRMRKEHIDVLLVCHGNSIRPMIRYFENLSSKEMMALEYTRHHIFHYLIPLNKGAAL